MADFRLKDGQLPAFTRLQTNYRGSTARPLELEWLHTLPIFLEFSCFFRHFGGQGYQTFYCKIHRQSIGGGTRGALGESVPTKFVSAHMNLLFHNKNVSC